MFEALLAEWQLSPAGAPIVTATGALLPVLRNGRPAMLKRFTDPEEAIGAALLKWWDGDRAARILAEADNAILMERATGSVSLTALSLSDEDDRACRQICATAARLHAHRPAPLPALTPLDRYFRALLEATPGEHPFLDRASDEARRLLDEPRDLRPLHGDLHHGNILDFGDRGFLAIDPKGLYGERAFDFANVFCNPDIDVPDAVIARDQSRFDRRLDIIAAAADLDRTRLLRWTIAWCGLSAVWFLRDDDIRADIPLTVGKLALERLAED
ncbi:phosphotransferase [Martelella mediterranea]|uniref:aminoglycoside phosphotransferase family protein n=1 Tax=Martelella mediterranea TaxID=293089 RepID=UPI001E652E2B|nr:aminoglycoside phosphotransferase family protein [Martelella mediterranea]MCD1632262.1 phosphotransferase [Martelella mediterranea]